MDTAVPSRCRMRAVPGQWTVCSSPWAGSNRGSGPAGGSHIRQRSQDRRWWVLAALVLAVLINALDTTIVNVALPTLATELSVGTTGLQWVLNAYLLVFAGLMLPAGALGDRYGRKRLLLGGLVLFGAGSLVATWAGSVGVLVAVRAVMGLGAAIVVPMVLAVLTVLFSEQERGRAVSLVVIGIGVGLPLGPIVSGLLLERFWWGSIFLINVPVVVLTIVAIGVLLPESRDPRPGRADLVGGLLSTSGLVALVYAVIEAPGRGWLDSLLLAAAGGAVVLLAAFVAQEVRTPEPMIDLRLFGRAQFAWGTAGLALTSFALFGLLFTLPQYLQFVSGFDALGTGVRLLPLVGGIVVGAPAGTELAARVGYRVPVGAGLLLAGFGLAVGATTGVASGYGFVAGWLAVAGLGVGLGLGPATDAVLGGLPARRSGSGSAVAQALRQVSGALGVAVLGSLLSHGFASRVVTSGLPPRGVVRCTRLDRACFGGRGRLRRSGAGRQRPVGLRPRDGARPVRLGRRCAARCCPHRGVPARPPRPRHGSGAPARARRTSWMTSSSPWIQRRRRSPRPGARQRTWPSWCGRASPFPPDS